MNRRKFLVGVGAVASAGTAGYLGGATGALDEYTSDVPDPRNLGGYDASAADLQLDVSQFGETGWEYLSDASGQSEVDADGADGEIATQDADASTRLFVHHPTDSLVMTMVIVYDGVGAAEAAYDGQHATHSERYSLQAFDVGAAAYGYLTEAAIAVFRDANAIGIVAYEPGGTPEGLEAARQFAELLYSDWG